MTYVCHLPYQYYQFGQLRCKYITNNLQTRSHHLSSESLICFRLSSSWSRMCSILCYLGTLESQVLILGLISPLRRHRTAAYVAYSVHPADPSHLGTSVHSSCLHPTHSTFT